MGFLRIHPPSCPAQNLPTQWALTVSAHSERGAPEPKKRARPPSLPYQSPICPLEGLGKSLLGEDPLQTLATLDPKGLASVIDGDGVSVEKKYSEGLFNIATFEQGFP